MNKIMCILCSIASILPITVHSQEGIQRFPKPDDYCTFGGEKLSDELWTFESDQQAADSIKKIAKYTGLEPNFKTRAANVDNAVAAIEGEERVILYNQNFMREMDRRAGTYWASVSILAHEIGHHLQGHTLHHTGSRPNQELEADKFSGFVLARMDATLEQARAAMATMNSPATETHPASNARLAAITNGWTTANDIKQEVRTAKSTTAKPSQPTPQEPVTEPITSTEPLAQRTAENPTPNLVAQIVIYNDRYRYFLTSNGLVMALTGLIRDNLTLYGRQLPPSDNRWAWMIQTPKAIYPVDRNGNIVGFDIATGQPRLIGYVASM